MNERVTLKQNARIILRNNYASIVCIMIITSVICDLINAISGRRLNITSLNFSMSQIQTMEKVGLIAMLWNFLVANPVRVGTRRFLLKKSRGDQANIKDLFFAFSEYYLHIVWVMFKMNLLEVLWGLLLIVPGVIKSFEYFMIPYLLADDPTMSSDEVFAKTKQAMEGYKYDLFVFDLSFIGWALLGAITLNIVMIFYTSPYYYLANTQFYLVRLSESYQ